MSQNNNVTRIYVADLPVTTFLDECTSVIDEDFLKQLFQENHVSQSPGSVIIKAKIDKNNNPYAYAFVDFETREDAVNAIKEFNYTKLDNIPIRLVLADEETINLIHSPYAKLKITNLDPEIEVSQLYDAFSNFGEIVTCKIDGEIEPDQDSYGKRFISNGIGYVQFRHQEDADQALKDLQDVSINGRPVHIKRCSRFIHLTQNDTFTKCFIKHLPCFYNDSNLVELFKEFGNVISCHIEEAEEERSIQQRGIVEMSTHEESVRAIEGINGRMIEGSSLVCSRWMSKHEIAQVKQKELFERKKKKYEENKDKYLYVRNFDEFVTEKDLLIAFSRFRKVQSVKIMRDEDGISKKFGFVNFSSKEAASECLKKSCLILINGKQIHASFGVDQFTRMKKMHEESKRRREMFHQMASNPIPNQLQYQQEPKWALRSMILEKDPNSCVFLQRVRDMSDQQAQFLLDDPSLFIQWMNQE